MRGLDRCLTAESSSAFSSERGVPVESARSAVPVLPPVRSSVPLAERGVPVSEYRALHGLCRSRGVGVGPGVGGRVASVAVAGDRHRLEVEQFDPVCRGLLPPSGVVGEPSADVLPLPAAQCHPPADHPMPRETGQGAQGGFADRVLEVWRRLDKRRRTTCSRCRGCRLADVSSAFAGPRPCSASATPTLPASASTRWPRRESNSHAGHRGRVEPRKCTANLFIDDEVLADEGPQAQRGRPRDLGRAGPLAAQGPGPAGRGRRRGRRLRDP